MGLANDIERAGYHMRELRIVDDQGERVAGFGTTVFRELTGGRFVTLGRSDLSRLLHCASPTRFSCALLLPSDLDLFTEQGAACRGVLLLCTILAVLCDAHVVRLVIALLLVGALTT
jgi:hypothetical protein